MNSSWGIYKCKDRGSRKRRQKGDRWCRWIIISHLSNRIWWLGHLLWVMRLKRRRKAVGSGRRCSVARKKRKKKTRIRTKLNRKLYNSNIRVNMLTVPTMLLTTPNQTWSINRISRWTMMTCNLRKKKSSLYTTSNCLQVVFNKPKLLRVFKIPTEEMMATYLLTKEKILIQTTSDSATLLAIWARMNKAW